MPLCTGSHHEFGTAGSLLHALRDATWDLVVLGWNLGDIKGRDMLRLARETVAALPPVVFLTAHDAPEDIVAALDEGAIDYILAPISAAVLRARLDAILRLITRERASSRPPVRVGDSSTICFGNYVFHRRDHYVDIRGRRIVLRPKEYALAMLLFENIGTPVPREYLHEALWGTLENFPSRALDTHVSRLRAKLSLAEDNGFKIKPIHRYGYRMDSYTTPFFA